MIAPKRRLTNHALHGREEWFKRIFRDQIAEAAGILEVVLSGIVLVALLMSIVPLVELMPGLLTDADSLEIRTFLERALDIVIGIEFIKMLAKHSPGSVLEVLLYAIARHIHYPQVFLCAVLRLQDARRQSCPGHGAEGRRDPGSKSGIHGGITPARPPGTAPHGMPGPLVRTAKICKPV